MKKGNFNSDKGKYISDIKQNNNQKEQLSIYNDSNKKMNLTAYKTQPFKKQYINYESLNNSSKKKDSKIYNIDPNNNDQYFLSSNNYLQNNIFENINVNEAFKSKINSQNYITPKNYIFGTDSKIKNNKNEIYFNNNRNIPVKIGEKFNKENSRELSKSTSNFKIPHSFGSINIIEENVNNNHINRELASYNNSNYNNYDYFTIRKNNLPNSLKEFKSQTQIEGGKKEINININHKNSSKIISKPKTKIKNINSNIYNNSNSINKIRNKSAKEKVNHYNIYNINNFDNNYNIDNNNGMNNKNNKILELKDYYDNCIINNTEQRKTQFNPNVNYYRNNMNKDYLYNTIKKKKNISIDQYKNEKTNNIKVYKSLNYEKNINKNKEIQNYHTNRINFNNYNIEIDDNNYILDDKASNGYNTYNNTFESKPIKVNLNKNNKSEIYKANNINSVNNNNNIQKYENKRNKSESKNNIKKNEEESVTMKRHKTSFIYFNSNKKNEILKKNFRNNTFDEKKSNYEMPSYNFNKDNDNYIVSEINMNYIINPNTNSNKFSKTTYIKKNNMNSIRKFKEYFTDNDRITNFNEDKNFKKYHSKKNSVTKIQKNINNNQIYISKNNYMKSEKIINKANKYKNEIKVNNNDYKTKLEFIRYRVANLLDIYSFLMENKYMKNKDNSNHNKNTT